MLVQFGAGVVGLLVQFGAGEAGETEPVRLVEFWPDHF